MRHRLDRASGRDAGSTRRRQLLIAWPALSAAAVLIERAAFPGTFLDVPEFTEDEEIAHVLRPD